MRKLWKTFSVVLAAVLVSGTGYAEDDDVFRPLAGIAAVQLSIEDLKPAAKVCGVTERTIQEAFMYPASSSRLKVLLNSNSGSPAFYINVLTLNDGTGCTSAINARLFYAQRVIIEATQKKVFAEIVLWDKGGILQGPARNHERQVRNMVENITKAFITDWNLANK